MEKLYFLLHETLEFKWTMMKKINKDKQNKKNSNLKWVSNFGYATIGNIISSFTCMKQYIEDDNEKELHCYHKSLFLR